MADTPRLDFVNGLTQNVLSTDNANKAKVDTARTALTDYYTNLPKLTDTYTNLREQNGIPQQEELVNSLTKNALNTQTSINNLDPAITLRAGNFDINEAKRQSIIARERTPLQNSLTDILKEKDIASIGLDQKQALVSQLLNLTQADQERGARPLQLGVDFTEKDREIATNLLTGLMGSQVSAYSGDVSAQQAAQEAEKQRQFQAAQTAEQAKLAASKDQNNFAQSLALENIRSANNIKEKTTVGAGTATEYMRLNQDKQQQATEDTFNNLVAGANTAQEVLNKIKENASSYASQGIDVNKLYSLYANLAARVGATGSIRSQSSVDKLKSAIESIPFAQ